MGTRAGAGGDHPGRRKHCRPACRYPRQPAITNCTAEPIHTSSAAKSGHPGIADTARNLTSFINDLLDLEKIESGSLTLDRVPVHLDQLLHDAAEQARGAAQGRISLEVTAAAGPAVMADPTRLEQVIANLVANACKFAPDGSTVTLTDCNATPASHTGCVVPYFNHVLGQLAPLVRDL